MIGQPNDPDNVQIFQSGRHARASILLTRKRHQWPSEWAQCHCDSAAQWSVTAELACPRRQSWSPGPLDVVCLARGCFASASMYRGLAQSLGNRADQRFTSSTCTYRCHDWKCRCDSRAPIRLGCYARAFIPMSRKTVNADFIQKHRCTSNDVFLPRVRSIARRPSSSMYSRIEQIAASFIHAVKWQWSKKFVRPHRGKKGLQLTALILDIDLSDFDVFPLDIDCRGHRQRAFRMTTVQVKGGAEAQYGPTLLRYISPARCRNGHLRCGDAMVLSRAKAQMISPARPRNDFLSRVDAMTLSNAVAQ
ncbi:uncharacterized protein SCHCODRAFT_02095334 [Schizophyllum commune H4-8]|uniref:uncharacterized protein n=1 Tax=Schizophyllum commune (strain H4-8 / FGSC 9210) TaxID=578458 RepID=UPI00215E69CA|nr:uncharacterized protein SCHCODRAFT_02095334 [Schizophyllum commune H4-8]KAI5886343.1 hypothetical protein SCHCODRAFT_02095334 [Schizophyllum commune H4-8]